MKETMTEIDVTISPEGNPVPMIWTTKGNLPISELEYRSGWQDQTGKPAVLRDNPTAVVFWEEHWHQGQMVRRSAHVIMRDGVDAFTETGQAG